MTGKECNNMGDLIYWVWLATKNGVGKTDALRLLEHFPGGAREIFNASEAQLTAAECSKAFISRLMQHDLDEASGILDTCFMNGIQVIPCSSPKYPKRLHDLHNKPVVLYSRGPLEDINDRFCVSIVGSRIMSYYGKHMTFTITRQLIAHGALIISGAAFGIDTVANNTAIYLEEPTVAVLGSGVNVPYPLQNKAMLEWVGEHGLILSEYPPGTQPMGSHFPMRNRIISGLADAVLVVEAGERSGAQITARYAAEQNRRVYAVPGNIGSPQSVGTNRMIRDGAKLVTCAADILEDFSDRFGLEEIERIVNDKKYIRYEYNCPLGVSDSNRPLSIKEQAKMPQILIPRTEKKKIKRDLTNIPKSEDHREFLNRNDGAVKDRADATSKAKAKRGMSYESTEAEYADVDMDDTSKYLDDDQKKVLESMPFGTAVTSDRIINLSGLPTEDVLSALTMLELLSMVERLPGDLFKKTNKTHN